MFENIEIENVTTTDIMHYDLTTYTTSDLGAGTYTIILKLHYI